MPPRPEAARRLFRPASGGRAGRRTRRRSTTWRARCRARRQPRSAPSSRASASTRTGRRRRSRNLSGGEKARLLLALATRDAPQLLILDEPTNHLDIDAREALVKALADFEGAVLLITHDPHLVELVADRLWLVADGTVRPFDGDLDDYRALLAERARPAARAEAPPTPARRPPGARRGARGAGAAAQAGEGRRSAHHATGRGTRRDRGAARASRRCMRRGAPPTSRRPMRGSPPSRGRWRRRRPTWLAAEEALEAAP